MNPEATKKVRKLCIDSWYGLSTKGLEVAKCKDNVRVAQLELDKKNAEHKKAEEDYILKLDETSDLILLVAADPITTVPQLGNILATDEYMVDSSRSALNDLLRAIKTKQDIASRGAET